jgi:hypothetical protein
MMSSAFELGEYLHILSLFLSSNYGPGDQLAAALNDVEKYDD